MGSFFGRRFTKSLLLSRDVDVPQKTFLNIVHLFCSNKALFVVWPNIDHIKDENDKLFSGFLWTNVKLLLFFIYHPLITSSKHKLCW